MTLDDSELHNRRNSDVMPRYFRRNSEEKENCSHDVSRRDSYNGSKRELRHHHSNRNKTRAMRYSVSSQCPNQGSSRKKSTMVLRSQSMRTPTRRPIMEAKRVSSVPIDHHRSSPNLGRYELDVNDYCRLRNFSITRKGAVVNRGDSFRSKSRSTHSVNSSRSSSKSSESPTAEIQPLDTVGHRVLMMGASEVGKTAITTQFTTSEYICACDASQDSAEEKSVTVVIDEQEAELVFIDPQYQDKSIKFPIIYNPDAYVIVYSVTSRSTFRQAKDMLAQLQKNEESLSRRAVVLVANKIDLVRSRTVTTDEGRSVAKTNKCKYIETSVGINHNVDNLLVGILSQIRLKKKQAEKMMNQQSEGDKENSTVKCSAKGTAGSLLKRILRKAYSSRTKSCDNLQSL